MAELSWSYYVKGLSSLSENRRYEICTNLLLKPKNKAFEKDGWGKSLEEINFLRKYNKNGTIATHCDFIRGTVTFSIEMDDEDMSVYKLKFCTC